MRSILFLAAAFAALAVPAGAGTITYTFHQTSASYPGLTVSASYEVEQGIAPKDADSHQDSPDFGGLLWLSIEGAGYPDITLGDLIPSCENFYGCRDYHGDNHDWGSPSWWISVPYLFYMEAIWFPYEPYHFEWDYEVSATSIRIGDDYGSSPCFMQFGCYVTGYWVSSADVVPEPASAAALIGGLLLLRRRRRYFF